MNLRLCSASKAKTVALMTFLCLTERYSAYTTDGMPKSFIKNIPESGKGIDTGFDVSAWKNGYTNCPQEVSSIMILTGNICSKSNTTNRRNQKIKPTILKCDIPKDFPSGTYYRNGHGRFESDDGVKAIHMFDGDGLMNAVTFNPQQKQILFRNRFVRTEGYVEDKATGKMSKRGVFGTMRSGGFWNNFFHVDVKNVANTSVVYHAKRLFALWEGGRPHELDPLTLKSIDEDKRGSDLGGLLDKNPEFSAHPRIDPETETLVNFGYVVDIVTGIAKITLYELDSNLRSKRSDEVSLLVNGSVLLHDFAITKNWHVFVLNFGHLDHGNIFKAIMGTGSFAHSVKLYDNVKATHVALVPRMKHLKENSAKKMNLMNDPRIKVISVPQHFNFHFSNAYEDDDGNVIYESAEQTENDLGMSLLDPSKNQPLWEVPLFSHLFPTKLVQYKINPYFECLAPAEEAIRVVNTRVPEFPTIPEPLSTKRHRYVYAVGSHRNIKRGTGERGSGPPGSIMKIDTQNPDLTEVYTYESYEFAGEASFVSKIGADVTVPEQEDRGYLVHFVSNGRDMTTDLVILDVEGKGRLEKGPVRRITMPTFIPHGLHGSFVEGLTFDFDQFDERHSSS
eukprot:CAMPEP_0172492182 /NCGR_PEP_ID=MMETSP1066-20121228/23219_1 /TAXON_ID=671091 /ORGANISM="Coscinodiscus wailesii, Strain CCMP2513" /LENGTH=619 /DNA_ID=CAMNT_0013261649 /DNA_START=859 /DNA_END=2719 /DNA_ORIENTATION=-